MTDRITVVFFKTAYDTLGGGSQMLLRLLDGLDKSKYELILLTQKRDVVAQEAEKIGVSVEIVPYCGALDTYDGGLLDGSIFKKFAAALRILQFNVEARSILEQADVLWIDEIRSYTTLLPYIILRNPITIWNIGLLQESDGILKWLHELALRTTDYVFIESYMQAENNFTESQFERYADKFEVFHKGINTNRFAPVTNDTAIDDESVFKIGTAALIHPRKNIDILIGAFAMLEREDVELHIAGEPAREGNKEYLNKLQDTVQEYGLESSVVFHGWVNDMPQFYSSLDVFVLVSDNEGIPGAIREAMSVGIPVIATDVGGTSEAVLDGETGFLVEPEDTKQISEKVSQLLDDSSKRKKFGRQGRRHIVEEFSIESYVRDYEQFLETITEK